MLGKIITTAVGIATLGYSISCFYCLNPNQDAKIKMSDKIYDEKKVKATGLHFKWTGIQKLEKYGAKRDLTFKELLEDLEKVNAYKKNLETVQAEYITTEEQVRTELEKIAKHFLKLGVADKVVMPKEVKFTDFGEKRDIHQGYMQNGSIYLNDRFQNDDIWKKSGGALITTIHEFLHIQELSRESATEAVTEELAASLAKEDKKYMAPLVEEILIDIIYSLYFIAIRDKHIPHDRFDQLMEEINLGVYADKYSYLSESEKGFFEKSHDKINGMLSKLKTHGKKEFVDKLVERIMPKEEYAQFKKRLEKRLETIAFDRMVYDYTGTTYQMIKDAIADDNILKGIFVGPDEKDIPIPNLAQELEKILK